MALQKTTIVDIQHKTFKKKLQGYDPTDVDQFLDEVIETLEDESSQRAALEAEISDLKERISHFKAMEESLQNTLLLAQRTADEVKASAHKEADLIRAEARMSIEKEISTYGDRANEARREHQRAERPQCERLDAGPTRAVRRSIPAVGRTGDPRKRLAVRVRRRLQRFLDADHGRSLACNG